ncbi:MAG: response regulator [Magnetococcales bacterium]|nr:response regulator [Magnetococcales bacterium]
MKLLSVDDSRTIRRVISGIGSTLGYEVLEAENGHQGLEVLEESSHEIGLILLDWNMPGMDGYEFLTTIKKHPTFKTIPVMMVTTEGEKSYIIKAVQAGAAHYLTKPFSQEDMVARILETMGMGGQGKGA